MAESALAASERPAPRTTHRPSLVAVTSQLPWPLNSGGHLRTFHLLRALAREFRIRLITKSGSDSVAGIAALADCGIATRHVESGRRRWSREAWNVAASAVRHEPYVLYRRHDRDDVRALLRDELRIESPDAVYFDHLDSLVFRSEVGHLPVVMDLHNVYSTLTQRVAEERRRWVERIYLRREARLLGQMERRAAKCASALMAVSAAEQEHYASLGAANVHLVPNGVDCASLAGMPLERPAGLPTILYLGDMSWGPNVSAAEFLAREVLPVVRRNLPNARLQIVGRRPKPRVRLLSELPGVEVCADVPSVALYLEQANVLAVPLEAGGGTRLKILEAFAAGLPVVSTPVGCEGIDAVHSQHLLISPRNEFAASLTNLLSNQELARSLARSARDLAWKQYDWEVVGRKACAAVATALKS